MFIIQNKIIKIAIHFLMLLLIFSIINVYSQSSSKYTIEKYSISMSGGYAESNKYEMVNIAGQLTLPGNAQSDNYTIEPGFLPGRNMITEIELFNKQIAPTKFALHQNYPNPFNTETTIQFQIPTPSKVTIKIFDILGNEVRELVNKDFKTGFYSITFDSRDNNGLEIASGVYFYRMIADEYVEVKKFLLLK